MIFKLKWWLNILLIFLQQQKQPVNATLYTFLIEDPEIFEDCKNEPNYLGASDIFDLSNLQIEVFDYTVHVEGSLTMQWDADPNDRVEMQSEVFKYERGSWQPTVFTVIETDFCTALFQPNNIWHETWGQYIHSDDAKCITNKGHTYHHQPFDLETVADVQVHDISGKHKIVTKINAYSLNGTKQPYSVCFEVVGDILRK